MPIRVCEGVWRVGGADLSGIQDCHVYLVDLGELVLVDCGLGPGWSRIADQIREAGYAPMDLGVLCLTHGHVDHIGAAATIKRDTGCRIVAHEGDVAAIAEGDPERTAAGWYDVEVEGVPTDVVVRGETATMTFRGGVLHLVHTPGHTPGSLSAYVDTDDGQRVLFGQDVHGPFHPDFGSDIREWQRSMERLLALEADILCEGHYGVFRGQDQVRAFIEGELVKNRVGPRR